ncbi:MAG: hypothetical protein COS34_13845 [Lysobacterales bacterium CG02_land_8_20_14_3_00_62_12]|nr:MAG: hypothetical protein COS34_13845 [Xanthomonadales bacterium CG02_land_8_20_14_3_00_62_12]
MMARYRASIPEDCRPLLPGEILQHWWVKPPLLVRWVARTLRTMSHSRIHPPVPEETLSQVLHACILEMLTQRPEDPNGACPGDVAKLAAEDLHMDWRDLMRPVRLVAARLAEQGRLEILKDGVAVNIREVRGDVRLRLKQRVRNGTRWI